MTDKKVAAGIGVALLLAVCGVSVSTTMASDSEDVIQLPAVIRDFSHNSRHFQAYEFKSTQSVAGMVSRELNESGDPVFTGEGRGVREPATDAQGRHIPPHLVHAPVEAFDIDGGSVTPNDPFAAQVEVLGAAISNGTYDLPVTMRVRIGQSEFDPFGSFDSATGGNVNDVQWDEGVESMKFVFPETFGAFTPISAEARSWNRISEPGDEDSDWSVRMHANTWTDSPQVILLRNGDPVPDIAGMYDQASIATYLEPLTDAATNTITLEDNQIIYLFELGGSHDSSSADFQDLVLLVSLATDPAFFETESDPDPSFACSTPEGDTPAELGTPDNAGVPAPESFAKWFRETPGHNVAVGHTIEMVNNGNGEYVFQTDDYTPIDGEQYGNGNDEHNRGFTIEAAAKFLFEPCSGQYLEVSGELDAWVYVNGRLALDLGGAKLGATQRVYVDRLGLDSGDLHEVKFFFAQRGATAAFEIRTNIDLIVDSSVINSFANARFD